MESNNATLSMLSAYSRKEALEDGVLIEIGTLATQAGFRIPVAFTSAVWGLCVSVPTAAEGQDETGRLWDVLSMLRWAARGALDAHEVRFQCLVKNDEQPAKLIDLKAVCGPGDDCEPVLTVMLPEED